jgi:hypothetical protein
VTHGKRRKARSGDEGHDTGVARWRGLTTFPIVGEDDFEAARDVLARIAERQPDIAVA